MGLYFMAHFKPQIKVIYNYYSYFFKLFFFLNLYFLKMSLYLTKEAKYAPEMKLRE